MTTSDQRAVVPILHRPRIAPVLGLLTLADQIAIGGLLCLAGDQGVVREAAEAGNVAGGGGIVGADQQGLSSAISRTFCEPSSRVPGNEARLRPTHELRRRIKALINNQPSTNSASNDTTAKIIKPRCGYAAYATKM